VKDLICQNQIERKGSSSTFWWLSQSFSLFFFQLL